MFILSFIAWQVEVLRVSTPTLLPFMYYIVNIIYLLLFNIIYSIYLFQIQNFQNILQTSLGSAKEDERKVFAALQVKKMSLLHIHGDRERGWCRA